MTRLHPLPVALLLAACAAPASRGGESPQADAGAPGDFRLTMERTPCFGTCPVYELRVAGSGAVRFTGTRFVATTGEAHDTIPAARVREMAEAVERSGFFEWDAQYTSGQPGCGDYHTDAPGIRLAVTMAGRGHAVQYDAGCQGAPRGIGALADRVDSLAGAGRWIVQR